jgi:citrate lyase subunit beta/citryl-CoA lyase
MDASDRCLPRSYLFVPADRPERIDKALTSGADAVIVDLEDAVAPSAKGTAREALVRWLEQRGGGPAATDATQTQSEAARQPALLVRVSATSTVWFEDDLQACIHPSVQGLVLPKAERVDELARVTAALPGRALLPLVETAAGMDGARTLAGAPGVQRLVFGSLDFQADLDIEDDGDALLLFRSHLVWMSRLGGVAAPVDGVTTNLQDPAATAADARRARALGFGAKLCIHPRQVQAVHEAFMPSADQLDWARRVLGAAEAAGGSAVAVDGKMVDAPVLLRARTLLERAERESAMRLARLGGTQPSLEVATHRKNGNPS